MLLYEMFLLYMEKPCATSTPCAPTGAHRPGLLTLSHRPASPRLAPTMNFVHLPLTSVFSMFADFSLWTYHTPSEFPIP